MFLALNIGSRILTAVICSAISILVISQLRKDETSRAFAALMFNIAFYAFCSAITRFVGLLGGDTSITFNISVLLSSTAGVFMIAFAASYFKAWNRWRRFAFLYHLIPHTGIVIFGIIFNQLNANIRITPLGFVVYDRLPLSNILLALGLVNALSATIPLIISKLIKRSPEYKLRILIGMLLVYLAPLSFVIQFMNIYSGELILYAIGSILMVGPVLSQRLFDPISRLNSRLTQHTEQLRTINQRVEKRW